MDIQSSKTSGLPSNQFVAVIPDPYGKGAYAMTFQGDYWYTEDWTANSPKWESRANMDGRKRKLNNLRVRQNWRK
jgi:hypothetical protein